MGDIRTADRPHSACQRDCQWASSDQAILLILLILQSEGRLGVTEVGRQVSLSQPAVSARIERLEQTGVITGYRATVDPALLGLNIHAAIRLRTTHAATAERLEAVVDGIARFGPVTTSLVLRTYETKPLVPQAPEL